MKPYIRIQLTEEQRAIAEKIYKTGGKNHIRQKAQALLFSHSGKIVTEIADILSFDEETIRSWFTKWNKDGFDSFEIIKGRGLKSKLKVEDVEIVTLVKEKVKENPQSLKTLLDDISARLGFFVSKGMLIKFLKKLNYSYRRIRKRLKGKPTEEEYNKKLDEITDLIRLEKSKFLKIYYVDEAGFNETPSVPYGWQMKGESLSSPSSRGQRWNVFGIMSSDNELFATKTKSSIKSAFVIDSIDAFAQSPDRAPRAALLIDNARIHHSKEFKLKISEWQEQGVEIFYLPVYSPHLNRIETLWRKIRYEWFLPGDFDSWQGITEKLEDILNTFGSKYTIKFKDY